MVIEIQRSTLDSRSDCISSCCKNRLFKYLVVFWVKFRFFDCVRLGSISSEIERNRTLSQKLLGLIVFDY